MRTEQEVDDSESLRSPETKRGLKQKQVMHGTVDDALAMRTQVLAEGGVEVLHIMDHLESI